MKSFHEIGSEYWQADRRPETNPPIPGAVYAASGRSAQSLIVAAAGTENHRAMLPAYTCQHIVEPFAWNGWTVDFYDINRDLTPNEASFRAGLARRPGCVLIQSYYGFPTAAGIVPLAMEAQREGAVLIEDTTHSFLNDTPRACASADYEFCSLRKWSGLSDGGYAVALRGGKLARPGAEFSAFAALRHEAREVKAAYVRTLDPAQKAEYIRLYGEAEEIIDGDVGLYRMSDQAYDDYLHLDLVQIRERRRANYRYLLEHLHSPYVQPIFPSLPEGVTPIMFPVYIPEHRAELRRQLIEQEIYCPVHWPAPVQLDPAARENSRRIYDEIMSIPCDQRYDSRDMERLTHIVNAFTPKESA